MEAADWTGIGVCVRLVEGVGGGELRQLAFFGGSLSWHLGGHQAVARAGGLQVPAAESAPLPRLGCSLLSSCRHLSFHLGAPEGIDATGLVSATRGQPRHTDFCFSREDTKLGRRETRSKIEPEGSPLQCMLGIFYSLVLNVLKTEGKPDIFKSSTEFEVSLVLTRLYYETLCPKKGLQSWGCSSVPIYHGQGPGMEFSKTTPPWQKRGCFVTVCGCFCFFTNQIILQLVILLLHPPEG